MSGGASKRHSLPIPEENVTKRDGRRYSDMSSFGKFTTVNLKWRTMNEPNPTTDSTISGILRGVLPHGSYLPTWQRIEEDRTSITLQFYVDMFKNRETFADAQWTEMEADLDRITDSFGRVATFGDDVPGETKPVLGQFKLKQSITEGETCLDRKAAIPQLQRRILDRYVEVIVDVLEYLGNPVQIDVRHSLRDDKWQDYIGFKLKCDKPIKFNNLQNLPSNQGAMDLGTEKQKAAKLEQENKHLRQTIVDLGEESETSLDIEKGKLSELVQENNDLKQEIIQLKEDMAKNESRYQIQKKFIDVVEKQFGLDSGNFDGIIANFQRIDELETALKEKNEQLEHIHTRVEGLTAELGIWHEKADKFRQELDRVSGDRKKCENMNASLKEKLQKAESELELKKQTMASLENQFQITTAERHSAERRVSSLEEQLRESTIDRHKLMEKIVALEVQLQASTSENNELGNQVCHANDERDFMRKRLESMISVMAANISNSETCLESMTKLMNADITDLRAKVRTLELGRNQIEKFVRLTNEGAIDYSVIMYVAENITGHWFKLGGFLGMSIAALEQIEHDVHGVEDRAIKMLTTWYKQHREDATKEILQKALERIPRKDIADYISGM